MDIELLREHCLSKPGVTEDFPFDSETLAFRVAEKIFALSNLERVPSAVNLKCDPERAVRLRAEYECIKPGFHMNKTHWNTVEIVPEISPDLLRELVDHSYELVVAGLTRKQRAELDSDAD